MHMFKRLAAAALILTSALPMTAQSEGGMHMSVEAEKKIDKKLSVSLEAATRSRNNFKTMDRWSLDLGAEYKLNKWLKAEAGYMLIDQNNREKINYKTTGAYDTWRPSYWQLRHRVYASLTGTLKLGNNFKVSLRERWQYTYRPEMTTQRWDFDDEAWEDKVRESKGNHVLRSRLTLSYDKKQALLSPYANIELYNGWGIEKVRYTVGTDIRLSKQHSLTTFYRFQNIRNASPEEYDPDMHYVGVGYKFKF